MNKYTIPNLGNACRVLKYLVPQKEGLTVSEISRKVEIPRTSALRIVSTLVDEGMLKKSGKKYMPGSALIHLGLEVLSNIEMRSASVPVLNELTLKTGETSHLAVLSDDKALILEVCDSPNPIRVASRAGTLADLHCSSTGKIFITYNLLDEIETFFENIDLKKRTSNTLTTVEQLRLEAEKIKQIGYALDNEEYHEGVICIAAPVRNAFEEVVAAVGLTATKTKFTQDKIPYYARNIIGAAAKISTFLGKREI